MIVRENFKIMHAKVIFFSGGNSEIRDRGAKHNWLGLNLLYIIVAHKCISSI